MVNQDHGSQTELLAEQTDEQLLENYKTRKCQTSFETLYKRWQPHLSKFLLRYTSDNALIEDAVQHTFMRLHTHHAELAAGSKISSWLLSLAANFTLDTLKSATNNRVEHFGDFKAGDIESFDPGDDQAERHAKAATDREMLGCVMGMVSAQDRKLIELIYLEGMSYAQVAEIASVPVGSVKSRVSRALAEIRMKHSDDQKSEAA